jgi:DNA-binding NarL/FixJ family response regulator
VNRSLRLVLADDHRVVRESLTQAIRALGHEVVAVACTGDEAVRLAELHRPDCVIVDVAMPEMDGIAAARRIASIGIATVALTMEGDDDTRERATAAGVGRFLTKDCSVSELIENVCALVGDREDPARRRGDRTTLTSREVEILRLLASGSTPAEVSHELVISAVTVKNHLASIYRKLGCRGRTGAVMYAYRSGLVDLTARAGRGLAMAGSGTFQR